MTYHSRKIECGLSGCERTTQTDFNRDAGLWSIYLPTGWTTRGGEGDGRHLVFVCPDHSRGA